MKRLVKVSAAVVVAAALATGCSQAAREEFRDAPINGHDDAPAFIYNMPDGWSNIATKCSREGHRLYTTMNSNGRAIFVLPNDPTCPQPEAK